MAIFNLFSKRQRKLGKRNSDIYNYEEIPYKLRVQIIYILKDIIGDYREHSGTAEELGRVVSEIFCRENGFLQLPTYKGPHRDINPNLVALFNHFLESNDILVQLDIIELSFRFIDRMTRDRYENVAPEKTKRIDNAIWELNKRLQDESIGYQYESGEIIRIDSKLVHSEIIKPVIQLLGSENLYSGANDEFLNAHKHYRKARYKECLNDCLKAFESTMKAICSKHHWSYKEEDTAKKLIEICFDNGLIPSFMQTQFTSLKSLLESGIPTIRNKTGAHGQGTERIEVPCEVASYALHLTATNILFLSETEKSLK